MREWYVKGSSQSLCSLDFYADYVLSLEADNGFGYSPTTSANFKTAQGGEYKNGCSSNLFCLFLVPANPPQILATKAISGSQILVNWREPSMPNGPIVSYQIYVKEMSSSSETGVASTQPTLIRLLVERGESAKSFAYNITQLSEFD